MKKLLSSLLFIALTASAASSHAQYMLLPGEDMFRTPERRYGHLEYFGFYASAMGSWNFTEELSSFTNLTWIHVGSADDPAAAIGEIIRRLQQARQSGVQATLSIEPFLFLNERGDLRSDTEIETLLIELWANIDYEGLLDSVAMIYPKDEPFREFVRFRNPPFYQQYITGEVYDDIHKDLVHVNELIKRVFPDKPIGVILSGQNLIHNFFSIPENYDWVGFDCYANLFSSCDNRSFVQLYVRLLNYMQPHQHLIAVPETWATNQSFERENWPEVLQSRLMHHYEIALNEPRFIAFIPFLWSFDVDTEVPGLGLNRFSELFDDGFNNSGTKFTNYVKRIGRQIKRGAPQFPNMAYEQTEDTKKRPQSKVRGEIMSINHRGLLSAWALNNALPHKNLRVQVLIRDSGGTLIHQSQVRRTFIRDRALRQKKYIGRQFVGTPGYRYWIPAAVLAPYKGQSLNAEIVIFADGTPLQTGHIDRLNFTVGEYTGG